MKTLSLKNLALLVLLLGVFTSCKQETEPTVTETESTEVVKTTQPTVVHDTTTVVVDTAVAN